MNDLLLDTNILVLAIRGRPIALSLLEELYRQQRSGYISTVTRAELLAGMHPHEAERTMALLESLITLSVDSTVADLAGRLMYRYARQGITLALADTLIAATAIVHNLTLATTNVKHFPVPELELYPVKTDPS